ncbi:hypothetical protein PHSY_002626 [Pseudozyma hubeiensis SY62]|uniref:RRM domain-containing protein n=1 Tax=Pseudozyma hubeiensis (strain SY62) TaxID=1305764 RepID=R9P1E4_PSEHS|nr:hypothetical protein PHSY_002626 [Pseudozyma hubeiensis SY62]GAC95051.1 hypothetical protein PHSY_002626 [Pseudozyma hubeiensis SY62]
MSEPSELAPATAVAADADRPLTNKEKRQLAVAQKRQAKESAAARKSKPSDSASTSTTTAGVKRPHESISQDDSVAAEEEPEVLSHKEARRRKKLLSSTTSDPSSSDPTPNSLVHPSRAPGALPPRSGFSIWIGNLSFFTPPSKLVDWFTQRGIDGITRVNMPKGLRRAEMNKGFCYLDLPNKDMLTAALNLSEQPLDGRKLLIKDGADFTGRPDINGFAMAVAKNLKEATTNQFGDKEEDAEKEEDKEQQGEGEGRKGKTGLTKTAQRILRAQKNPPSMTLFLGNLSFNTTEQGVRELFDHSATKRNPKPKVKKVRKKVEKKKSSSGSSSSSSSSDAESDSESDSDSDSDSSSSSSSEAPSPKPSTTKTPGQGDVLPSPAGIRKVRLGTFEDAPDKCKGFGFIDFHTTEFATSSLLDTRNAFLDGRRIVLQYASPDATRRGAGKAMRTAIDTKKPNALRVGFQRNKPKRSHPEQDKVQEEREVQAPVPGSFDPNAPLEKKHKETKEERIARRAAQGSRGGPADKRRAKPGAALANAQRASTAVVQSTGTKVTFDD